MQAPRSAPFIPLQASIDSFALLVLRSGGVGVFFLRLSVFMQSTFSIPFFPAQTPIIIDDSELLLEEDIVLLAAEEDDEEVELSAKLSGTETATVASAVRKERDFFIKEIGENSDVTVSRMWTS